MILGVLGGFPPNWMHFFDDVEQSAYLAEAVRSIFGNNKYKIHNG